MVNNEDTEETFDWDEEQSATALEPRRVIHPREKLTLIQLIKWALGPLKPAKPVYESQQKLFRTPDEWPQNSRYGAKRRAKRIRLRKRLLTIKYSKRIGAAITGIVIVGTLVFWAKFAVVYDIPSYVQVGSFQNVEAYVVYKSWWFGPPSFNLSDFSNLDPTNPELSLILQLDHYRDIITNPNEIVYVMTKNTNNTAK